jgi:hypothetical protein
MLQVSVAVLVGTSDAQPSNEDEFAGSVLQDLVLLAWLLVLQVLTAPSFVGW